MERISEMKKILVLAFLFCASCATNNKYTVLKSMTERSASCSLDIYMVSDPVPRKYETIGVFSVTDNGLSANCDMENAIAVNKVAACKAGALGIKFTEVLLPNGKSTCVQTQSNFLIYK